jgi:flagellar hook-associated protein 1
MINLIQFQRGFQSSAKFLSTVDELMNDLMAIKR